MIRIIISIGINPVAPLEVDILEQRHITLCHRQEPAKAARKHIKNAKAPLGSKAILDINRNMGRQGRKASKQIRLELASTRPTVAFVESLANDDTRSKMPKLIQVQSIVEIVLEMETTATVIVPPAFFKNKAVGRAIGNQSE